MFRSAVLAAILAVVLGPVGSAGWESPQQFNAANCTNVRIPPRMCGRCHLRPLNSAEKARYKKDIFDFETRECLAQLREYVRLNPCDTKRAHFLANYKTNMFAYDRVAQFLYTVCEQCCDMIPIGSKRWEYWRRKKAGTLHTDVRGNGVAHFYFDICKLFPKITRFIRPKWRLVEGMPELCPPAVAWMESDLSDGWTQNANASGIAPALRRSLTVMAKTLGCRDRKLWQDCIVEEQSINRV